jgi:tetratricopeptide (TPR) repeat protein
MNMHDRHMWIRLVIALAWLSAVGVPFAAQEILSIPPEALEAYHQGVFYGKSEKYVEAVMELNHAITTYPEYVDAHNALGVVYHQQQQLDNAIASYRRAIELDPRHAKALTNLALVYKERGEYENALRQLQDAVDADPAYAAAQKLLPEVRQLFEAQQRSQPASAEAETAAQSPAPVREITVSAVPPATLPAAPKSAPAPSPQSPFEQGTTLVRQGKLDAGIAAYQQALRQRPCSSEGLTLLGLAYREKFRVTQELTWQQEEVLAFQKAIQCDPAHIPAVLALGETMYAQKDYANAARYFRYVLQFEPHHPARAQIEEFLRTY